MKVIFTIALAVAAMASCAKSEVVDVNSDNPNVIKFSTYTGAITKTTNGYTNAEDKSVGVTEIGVYATASNADDLSTLTIPNTKLTYTEYSGWSTSNVYYWPATTDEVYTFYSYYPFAGTAEVAALTNGVITGSGSEVDDSKFPIVNNATGQVDILAGIDTPASQTSVLIQLQHMLSKVDFQVGVKSESAGSAIKVTINSIKLNNIIDTHSGLDLKNSKLLTNTTAATYYYGDVATNFVLVENSSYQNATISGTTFDDSKGLSTEGNANNNETYVDIDAAESTGAAFLLLPQKLTTSTESDQEVTVNYTITQNGKTVVDAKDITFDLQANNSVTTWEQGTSYLYKILFDGSKLDTAASNVITFDVEVQNWPTSTTQELPGEGAYN
ncbi:MAG: fimbrillin family protein [Rikenellaceae bacterium]